MQTDYIQKINLDENYDWQATRAIFLNDVIMEKDSGEATLRIPINCQQLLAFRILSPQPQYRDSPDSNALLKRRHSDGEESVSRESDEFWINPRFQYLVLSEIDDTPIVQVTFPYTSNDCGAYPDSIHIDIVQYPKLWPLAEKELWLG